MKQSPLAPILPLLLLVLAPACAPTRPLVRADEMSAAQHRTEAEREQAAATSETRASEQGGGAERPASGYDDSGEHRRRAEGAREHARQHAAAAEFLEQFEDEECAGVPRGSRAACPLLGPLVRLEDVPGGIRATFVDRLRVRPAIAEMRCHYAFARVRHFDEKVGCPLYVLGIEIRPGLDPRSVEIVAHDEKTVRLIRERSRAQAIVVGPRR